jgi:hypothetical protein
MPVALWEKDIVGPDQLQANIFEDCCGIFGFVCYIPALSKGLKTFPMRKKDLKSI